MRLSRFLFGGERIAREFAKAFYNSPEWEKTRQYVLARDKYKCVKCGRPAEEVHHKKHLTPDNIHDPWIALNPDNLASLCKDCHFAEHREDKAAGNSIALPFWQWLMDRISAQLKKDGIEEQTMASLFDGIGGFPLVSTRAGVKPLWCSEIEEFPIAVTKKHFSEVKNEG